MFKTTNYTILHVPFYDYIEKQQQIILTDYTFFAYLEKEQQTLPEFT